MSDLVIDPARFGQQDLTRFLILRIRQTNLGALMKTIGSIGRITLLQNTVVLVQIVDE